MPVAFSRSMRSLHADGRSRRAFWFLPLPVLVLAAWTAWFFEARIARYENSDRAWIESGRVVAEFGPSAAAQRVRAGQRARVAVPGWGSVAAQVTHLDTDARNGRTRAELAVSPSLASSRLQPGMAATVEVEVESISPAALVLRAAGYRQQTP